MTGKQLRNWMRRYGYTVQVLGARLCVAERTIYRWRSADAIPCYIALALEALELRAAREGPRTEAAAGARPRA